MIIINISSARFANSKRWLTNYNNADERLSMNIYDING